MDISTENSEPCTTISVGEHPIEGAGGYIANEFAVNMTVLS